MLPSHRALELRGMLAEIEKEARFLRRDDISMEEDTAIDRILEKAAALKTIIMEEL